MILRWHRARGSEAFGSLTAHGEGSAGDAARAESQFVFKTRITIYTRVGRGIQQKNREIDRGSRVRGENVRRHSNTLEIGAGIDWSFPYEWSEQANRGKGQPTPREQRQSSPAPISGDWNPRGLLIRCSVYPAPENLAHFDDCSPYSTKSWIRGLNEVKEDCHQRVLCIAMIVSH